MPLPVARTWSGRRSILMILMMMTLTGTSCCDQPGSVQPSTVFVYSYLKVLFYPCIDLWYQCHGHTWHLYDHKQAVVCNHEYMYRWFWLCYKACSFKPSCSWDQYYFILDAAVAHLLQYTDAMTIKVPNCFTAALSYVTYVVVIPTNYNVTSLHLTQCISTCTAAKMNWMIHEIWNYIIADRCFRRITDQGIQPYFHS